MTQRDHKKIKTISFQGHVPQDDIVFFLGIWIIERDKRQNKKEGKTGRVSTTCRIIKKQRGKRKKSCNKTEQMMEKILKEKKKIERKQSSTEIDN